MFAGHNTNKSFLQGSTYISMVIARIYPIQKPLYGSFRKHIIYATDKRYHRRVQGGIFGICGRERGFGGKCGCGKICRSVCSGCERGNGNFESGADISDVPRYSD